MIPVALVINDKLLRIQWCENIDLARIFAGSWLNGAKMAHRVEGFHSGVPSVYLPTVTGLTGAPPALVTQIELALEST